LRTCSRTSPHASSFWAGTISEKCSWFADFSSYDVSAVKFTHMHKCV
jgi:hypothetical protein